jgi:hypothetical protein
MADLSVVFSIVSCSVHGGETKDGMASEVGKHGGRGEMLS